jgi:hypothetical protein
MLKLSTGARNAMLGTGSFRATFNTHVLKIYGGSEPASPDDAIGAATLLCTISTNGTGTVLVWETTPAAGALTKSLSDVWSGVNAADGDAAFFRLLTIADANASSTAAVRLQGNCALAGGDLNLSSLTLVAGATQTIDFGSVALPES